MFNELGLGVTLTLKDEFTPKANTVSQSMGRMIKDAEGLEKNIQTSMHNLQNTMLAGFSLGQTGEKFEKAGQNIIGTLENVYTTLGDVGNRFETMKKTMNVFFKEETESAMKWGVDLAAKTPFEIEPVVNAMSSFKAMGIDVRKEFDYVTASGEKASKSFMEFVGDLGAVRPDIGVKGVMEGIRNYMGGNKRSLRARIDLDERQILGREFDTSNYEQFQKDIVEFTTKVAPDLMKSLEGTADQLMSNLGDTFTWFAYKVTENGLFESMKGTLKSITKLVGEVDLDRLAKPIGETLAWLWKPIDLLAKSITKVTLGLAKLAESNPMLARLVTGLVAFTGIALVGTGLVMKLAGNFLVLGSSLLLAYTNLKVLGTFQNVLLFTKMASGAKKLINVLGLLGIATAIFGYGFKNNVGGIQTKWNSFMTDWKNSAKMLNIGLGPGFEKSLRKLGIPLTQTAKDMMRFRTIAGTFTKSLFGTTVNGEIQYTTKQLENLRQLGLMPFAQSMAIIRGRIDDFWSGLKDGAISAFHVMKSAFDFIIKPFKEMLKVIKDLDFVKGITSLFNFKDENGLDLSVAEKQAKAFNGIGKAVGGLMGAFLGFKTVVTLVSLVTKPFELLRGAINGTKKSAEGLKTTVNTMGDLQFPLFKKTGDYYSDFKQDMRRYKESTKQHMYNYLGRDTSLPTKRRKDGTLGYSKVYANDAPNNITPLLASNPNADMNKMYTRDRNKLVEKLFGATYYSKNSDGEMVRLARYGGALGKKRDDEQLRLSLEHSAGIGKEIYKPKLSDYTRDESGIKFEGEMLKRQIEQFKLDKKSYMGIKRGQVGDVSNLKGNPFTAKSNDLQKQKQDLINSYAQSADFRAEAYKYGGVDGRKFNGFDPTGKLDKRKNSLYENFITKGLKNEDINKLNSEIGKIKDQAKQVPLMVDSNQSKLSKALFGQKIYTPSINARGDYEQKVLGRRGGIFRDKEDDFKYTGTQTSDMFNTGKTVIRQPKMGMGQRISSKIGGFKDSAKSRVDGAFNPLLSYVNTQRGRLGYDQINSMFSTNDKKGAFSKLGSGLFRRPTEKDSGGFIPRLGHGIFGRATKDEQGNVTRKGGIFSRGIGAVKGGVKGLGKGLGAVGRFGMGIAPLAIGGMALANAGVGMVKAKGDGDFKKGLEVIHSQINSVDWGDKFKTVGKGLVGGVKASVPVVKDLAKGMARGISENFKPAMEGVKAIGSKGFDILKNKSKGMWDNFKANGAQGIANIASIVLPKGLNLSKSLAKGTLKALKWVVTDGLPGVLGVAKTLVSNGLSWVVSTGFPKLVSGMKSIAGKVGNALGNAIKTGASKAKDAVVGMFSNLVFSATMNIKSIFDGGAGPNYGTSEAYKEFKSGKITNNATRSAERTGKLINSYKTNDGVGSVGKTITSGLPKFHTGTWMQPFETPAIIRKDETVLNPSQARGLDSFLVSQRSADSRTENMLMRANKQNRQTTSGSTSIKVDNVNVTIQADKLSRAEAREQAKMILSEVNSLSREQGIREYS